ncbi:hypothetical protein [Prosthecochloris sp.]|uniref:hypothetical protein n=1 Tax=Prosthecochloris sp. TaxID=290513 RepID=UPI0025FE7CE6|nr:hypothetical protein [Prosthecochloris sp.]
MIGKTVLLLIVMLAGIADFCLAKSSQTADYSRAEGEEFVFAKTFPGGEKYGYQGWSKRPTTYKGGKLSYDEYVGRKGKIETTITFDPSQSHYISEKSKSKFRKAVLENGEVVYVHLVSNSLPHNIYLTDEVNRARSFIGQKIWVNNTRVVRPQELITSDENLSYPTYNTEPLAVIDVFLGKYGHGRGAGSFSIRVRKSSGEEGLIKFYDRYFYTSNPIPPGSSQKVRQAIERQEVIMGMTEKEAVLSWGEPEKVNESVGSWGVREQWVYGYSYLYFKNGNLTSWQTTH